MFTSPSINKQTEEIKKAFDLIKYRGPDNTKCLDIDSFLFCHHRLSIIQHNKENTDIGTQPIQKNGIVLICNGEIYNYKELCDELSINYKDLAVECEIQSDRSTTSFN